MTAPQLFADLDLARRLEGADLDLLAAAAELIARRHPELDVFRRGVAGGLVVHATEGSPLNKLFGAGLHGPPTNDDLQALSVAETVHEQRGAPLTAEVATLADPALGAELTGRGYRLRGFENLLALPLDAPQPGPLPAGLTLEPVEDDGTLELWIDTVVSGFVAADSQGVAAHEAFARESLEPVIRDFAAVDGMRHLLARWEGAPAGGASVRHTDDICQLCGASTLPEFRRRGVQTALLGARLARAAADGCELAVVTTLPGSKSQQNVQRQGFQLVYGRSVLVREPGGPDDLVG